MGEPKRFVVGVRIAPDTLAAAKKVAADNEMSFSRFVEAVLRHHLDEMISFEKAVGE
jgi:hypothetical protein